MDFVLKNDDVQAALIAHINTLGINTTGKVVELTFKTTRKPVTITASVSIRNPSDKPVTAPVPTIKEAAEAVIIKTVEAVQDAPKAAEPAKLEVVQADPEPQSQAVDTPTEPDTLTEQTVATKEPQVSTQSLFG